MGKNEIIDIIKSNKSEMESRYGVRRVGLFGSYVKGRQRKKSDIDILVAFSRDIDLFDFFWTFVSTSRPGYTLRWTWLRSQPSGQLLASGFLPRSNMYKAREFPQNNIQEKVLPAISPPPRDPPTGWVPRSVEPPLLAHRVGWSDPRFRLRNFCVC